MNETLSAFSGLVQALTGIAALVLSIVVALQSKKIQELEDVAKELAKQTGELQAHTKILATQLALDRRLTLTNRIGFLEKVHNMIINDDLDVNSVLLVLKNTGIRICDLKFEFDSQSYRVHAQSHEIEHLETVAVTVHYQLGHTTSELFDFKLTFSNASGEIASQRVYRTGENAFTIEPPIDIN